MLICNFGRKNVLIKGLFSTDQRYLKICQYGDEKHSEFVTRKTDLSRMCYHTLLVEKKKQKLKIKTRRMDIKRD
jgi:hypothetical protein